MDDQAAPGYDYPGYGYLLLLHEIDSLRDRVQKTREGELHLVGCGVDVAVYV